tara:strand:+ start:69 stop:260 length:192 start_codon:yes stop_codon:yes gene_type:complete
MNKYLITDVVMVLVSCYIVYAIGNYQLLPNIGEANAAGICVIALGMTVMGVVSMFSKIRKTKK